MSTNSSVSTENINFASNMSKVYKPKSKGISIYDVERGRMVHYKNPYGVKAKKAYKQYLELGYEPSAILPKDLKHYPPSYTSNRDTFRRIKPKKPESIEGRTAFKNFLAHQELQNPCFLPQFERVRFTYHHLICRQAHE